MLCSYGTFDLKSYRIILISKFRKKWKTNWKIEKTKKWRLDRTKKYFIILYPYKIFREYYVWYIQNNYRFIFWKYNQFFNVCKRFNRRGTTLLIKVMKVQNNNFEILYFTCRSSTPLLSSAFNSSNMLLSIPKGQHRKI